MFRYSKLPVEYAIFVVRTRVEYAKNSSKFCVQSFCLFSFIKTNEIDVHQSKWVTVNRNQMSWLILIKYHKQMTNKILLVLNTCPKHYNSSEFGLFVKKSFMIICRLLLSIRRCSSLFALCSNRKKTGFTYYFIFSLYSEIYSWINTKIKVE